MIIAAFKRGSKKVYTKSVHQFDKGQKLIVTGIILPDSYEVHMSNEKDGGIAYACVGNAEGVYIPNALFVSGDYVYIWIYATAVIEEGGSTGYDHDPEEETIQEETVAAKTIHEGETVYEIVVPVIRRPVHLPAIDIDSSKSFGYMVDGNETLVPVRN